MTDDVTTDKMTELMKIIDNMYNLEWWKESVIPFIKHKTSVNIRKLSLFWFNSDIPPCAVMDEDWDNLIILDGCRFDQFQQLNTISGQLEARMSLGSATPEFLEKNFRDNQCPDTIYVTANPQYRKRNLGNVFHDVVDVWEFGWDDQLETVPPDTMVSSTLEAYDEYPNKKVISHFIQPHYPFIGETGLEIKDHAGMRKAREIGLGNYDTDRNHIPVWERLSNGEISEDLVRDAYDENLQIALNNIRDLIDEIDGKTVITSDHGNLFGKRVYPFRRKFYGHPDYLYTEELRKVPWFICNNNRRKDIKRGETDSETNIHSDIVDDRLNSLGYLNN